MNTERLPCLVPGTTLVIFKVVLGTKRSYTIFEKNFRTKNGFFGPGQVPKNNFY
jgi:hypothetical protein